MLLKVGIATFGIIEARNADVSPVEVAASIYSDALTIKVWQNVWSEAKLNFSEFSIYEP